MIEVTGRQDRMVPEPEGDVKAGSAGYPQDTHAGKAFLIVHNLIC